MIQLCARIRACKCQKHSKKYSFIHTAENCQNKLRGMCHRCVNLEPPRELFNIDNLFEFLKAEQNYEDGLINTYKASIWQQFKRTQIQIIELLEQLEIKLEAFLDDICGNTILTKIKEQYFDKEIKLDDVEAFGQLLGNYIERDKKGNYQQKEQLKIEQQDSYIKSIEINQVQDQAKTILKQLALQYTHGQQQLPNGINLTQQVSNIQSTQTLNVQESVIFRNKIDSTDVDVTMDTNSMIDQVQCIQSFDPQDFSYSIGQRIKLDNYCYYLCFNHNESQIAAAVRKSIILFNLSQDGIWIQDKQSLIGHTNWILQVKFNHNSTQMASCSYDKLVIIWCKQQNGQWSIQQQLNEHTDYVRTICYNHDSTILALGSDDKSIIIYHLNNDKWQLKQKLCQHTDYVFDVCFNHESTLLASGNRDYSIILWECDNVGNWIVKQQLTEHTNSVRSVSFNSQSSCLISGSDDNTIKIWSVDNQNNWKCSETLTGHTNSVLSAYFNKESNMISSSSGDGQIKIWNINKEKQWECTQTINEHTTWVRKVLINSDSSMIISGSDDETILIHNRISKKQSSTQILQSPDIKVTANMIEQTKQQQ